MTQLAEAPRYKPEGRGFDSRWCHWNNPSCRTMALGLTQPLTEMSTRIISWWGGGKGGWCVWLTHLTTFMCRLSWNLEASTSWNPQGLSRPVMGLLYLFLQFPDLCLFIIFLVHCFSAGLLKPVLCPGHNCSRFAICNWRSVYFFFFSKLSC